MPCEIITLPDGTKCHVKFAKERAKKCAFCGNPATRLCDGVSEGNLFGESKPCDKPVCAKCRREVGEQDFCPEHWGQANG